MSAVAGHVVAGRAGPAGGTLLQRLVCDPARAARVTHVEHVPARAGRCVPWPSWVPDELTERLARAGVPAPWEHQAAAADLAWQGTSVVLSTGTASGKSLGYLLPVLSTLLTGDRATALYLAPTKALAGDQLRAVQALDLAPVRAASYDGDTGRDERDWVRRHGRLVLTNPDMLHRGVLPRHGQFASFLRGLAYVVVDECHAYRGVFGSHVAQVLRRLRRVCAHYGARPVFVLASATCSDAAGSASRLTGLPVAAVSADASPRGATAFALWEPPLLPYGGEHGAPVRRSATAETGELLADLVIEGARSLAFVRSRRGAEAVALSARRAVAEAAPELAPRLAAYRGGYLPEERRDLERRLQTGELLGVAATNALELGVDVAGLDAVVLTGWPGTVASVWQQAGRAGRAGQDALAVLVARDDPLDTYLAHHPQALFGRPVEATVLGPGEPVRAGPAPVLRRGRAAADPDDLPRFDNAAVDGYAFAGAALDDADRKTALRLLPGRAAAGHPFPGEVPLGACVRTLTGAAMPKGTDTVLMQEEASLEGAAVVVPAGFEAGSNRRARGEDIRAGQAVFEAGLRLAPHHLGVLAGLGGDRVRLRAPLRVALCSSGDELREPGADLPPGGVFDANRYILKGLLRHLPVTVTDLGILPDDRETVEAVLAGAAADHDVVLASGGASRGDEDHVVRAVERLGRIHFWRIAMKPGRPLAFGEIEGAVFVGLPGNPVATTVCFLRLARPVLLRLAGSSWSEPTPLPVPAAFAMRKKPGRTELLRGRLVAGRVERIRREGSGILTSLTDADGLIEIGADVEKVGMGDLVPYFSFAELGAL